MAQSKPSGVAGAAEWGWAAWGATLVFAGVVGAVVALGSLAACGATDGTETGRACAESTLIAQCPPGSDPRLDAEARSMCEGDAEVNLVRREGSVTGSCEGEGSCRVLCQFAVPCECGVDAITSEGVFCTRCADGAACGNGTCEAGETPENCPEDCAMVCAPGRERCNGDAREECNQQGRWEMLPCPEGDTCRASTDEPGEVVCAPR